jgi:hypothetical protein
MQKKFLNQTIKNLINYVSVNSCVNRHIYLQNFSYGPSTFSFHKNIYQYTSLNAATKTEEGRLNLGA